MATIQLQKQRLVEGDYLLQEGVHFPFLLLFIISDFHAVSVMLSEGEASDNV